MSALLAVAVVAARKTAALVLDVAAMREALAVALAGQRADGDAREDRFAIFARVFFVVVRQCAGVTTAKVAFDGRRWRRPAW